MTNPNLQRTRDYGPNTWYTKTRTMQKCCNENQKRKNTRRSMNNLESYKIESHLNKLVTNDVHFQLPHNRQAQVHWHIHVEHCKSSTRDEWQGAVVSSPFSWRNGNSSPTPWTVLSVSLFLKHFSSVWPSSIPIVLTNTIFLKKTRDFWFLFCNSPNCSILNILQIWFHN